MAILAIDTSTSVCVLGVREGQQTWRDETDLGRTHSQEILPRIEALLARAEIDKSALDLIVYGQGPGSFTGLRIGIGVVQGLAYGLQIPVVGVSSLACLAAQVVQAPQQAALVALAARNTEVYFGAYGWAENGVRLLGREGVFEAAEIPEQDSGLTWFGIGDGWTLAESLSSASGVIPQQVMAAPTLSAVELLDLGESAAAAGETRAATEALPEYLREQVATAKN
ncbi:MAG: tRNA (adenosine(37)-N6)-threonylcarbamoyltransferase complex dimerization subunit type 1 TsaB [Pseudomonadales bacterium]